MPLYPGKSKRTFSRNVKAEMDAGKPQKVALAISYAKQAEKPAKERKLPSASGRPRGR